jgi:hypothetical protein
MSEEDKLVEKLEVVPDTAKPAAEPAAPQYDTKPVIKLPSKELAISNEEIKVSIDRPYLTYQEHVLAGIPVCDMYKGIPYKPVGVIDGLLKVEEASRQRQEKGRIAAQGRFFGHPGCVVQVSLEALTIEGLTKKDPCLLNEKLEPMNTNYSEDFPYRRK